MRLDVKSGVMVAMLVSVVVAGCGEATKSATQAGGTAGTTSVTKARAEGMYLASVAPVNTAGEAFQTVAKSWTSSTTASRAAAAVAPLATALTGFRTKLVALADAYPPAASDLRALMNADAQLIRDLASTKAPGAFSASSLTQRITDDNSKASKAADAVRSELGLPPPQ
jgi:hypothetical protein